MKFVKRHAEKLIKGSFRSTLLACGSRILECVWLATALDWTLAWHACEMSRGASIQSGGKPHALQKGAVFSTLSCYPANGFLARVCRVSSLLNGFFSPAARDSFGRFGTRHGLTS